MKEKRYIVVEVECEVEFDATDEAFYLTSDEWEQLEKFSTFLYQNSSGWVTKVSSFKRTEPK